MRFTVIDERDVIIVQKGVYKQVPVYRRQKKKGDYLVYAKYGSGFIRLYKNGTTSSPNVRWDETDLEHKFTQIGRMVQKDDK